MPEGEESVAKTQRLRLSAICQRHQFQPFDRIAGKTEKMTFSARLEQHFSITRYHRRWGPTSFFSFFIDI